MLNNKSSKNMGIADRVVRVALALGVLYLLGKIGGPTAIVLGIAAAAFLLTGFVGTCPIYLPFHLSTRRGEEDDADVGRKQ